MPSDRRFLRATLVFLLDDAGGIWLGMKKRGFKKGYFNGFGGKFNRWESNPLKVSLREVKEETGIALKLHELEHAADVFFHHPKTYRSWIVHTYMVRHFTGTPVEGEEVKPERFRLNEIPFAKMTPDVRSWLPKLLSGKKQIVDVHLADDGEKVIRVRAREVAKLERLSVGRKNRVVFDRPASAPGKRKVKQRLTWSKKPLMPRKR